MKSTKNYNITATFDSGRLGLQYITPRLGATLGSRSQGVLCSITTGRPLLVPNAPQAARHTLLAECLKRGICGAISAADWLRNLRSIRAGNAGNLAQSARRSRLTPRDRALSCSAWIGQLVSVEFEYYPTEGREDALSNRLGLGEMVTDGSLGSRGREWRQMAHRSQFGFPTLRSLGRLDGRHDSFCGLHVHVDARTGLAPSEKERQQAARIYSWIVQLYPLLKKLVPESRRSNQYCKWINNLDDSSSRYAAVNFHSYDKHRTIEFRCQEGSTDGLFAEQWAAFCWAVVDIAKRATTPGIDTPPPRTMSGLLAVLPAGIAAFVRLRAAVIASRDAGFRPTPETASAVNA